MERVMPHATDYTLPALLGIAGATIALVIAGAILLQGFHNKYVQLFGHYRGLTGEYRGHEVSDPRRGSLKEQITNYRRRISYINTASVIMGLALLLFLFTIGVASLSVIYPDVRALRVLGTASLFVGLVFIVFAVCLDLTETVLSRRVIGDEVSDFNDLPDPQEAWKRWRGAS
jgi:hypothetical protein